MKTHKISATRIERVLTLAILIFCAGLLAAQAQTTAFTYQGRFTDTTVAQPTNGSYTMTFRLFDQVTGGNQLPDNSTVMTSSVNVVNGIFTVRLDFGAATFNPVLTVSSTRYLEIRVGNTILTPRQEITSTPFAVNAKTANELSTACVGCVTNAQISSIDGAKVSGTVANATNATQLGGTAASNFVQTDNTSFVRNQTTQQASTDFNVGGTGEATIFNARTEFRIGGNRVFSIGGTQNLFTGFGAGQANTSGYGNSFVGNSAGFSNAGGFLNAFFGTDAGRANTTGSDNVFAGVNAGGQNNNGSGNAFFGRNAGAANTTGSGNTMLGVNANVGAGNLTNATAVGAGATVSTSNTVVLGRTADAVQIPGSLTVAGTITGTATNATNAVNATNAANIEPTGGNSVVNSINNAATNTTINSSRLSPDVVLLNPAAPQDAVSGNTNTILNLRGNSQNLFRANLNGGFLVTGQYDGGAGSGGIPIEGAGTRMMWYPNKGAFRAGYVSGTQWDDENTGDFSTAFGLSTRASGAYGFAAGRAALAVQTFAIALGEGTIASGAASVALGTGANTNARQGSFVFADRSVPLVYDSSGNLDQTNSTFLRAGVNHSANWRVSGGFRIFTSSNLSTGVTIQSGASTSNWGQPNAVISTSTGAYLSTSGVWTDNSSRSLKTNFSSVDSRDVLQKVLNLPVQTWNYKADTPNIRHIGVMAQDFYQAFRVGADDEHITAVDTAGVTMAAIQGVHEELSERTTKLQTENDTLKEKLAKQQTQITGQQKQIDALIKLICVTNQTADVCQKP